VNGAVPSSPVFLIGAARSGTSLLYKSLCLHPDAAYISNWVRRFPAHPELAGLNRLPVRLSGMQRTVWFGGGGNAYVYGSPRRLVERLFPMPVEGEPVFAHCGIPEAALDEDVPAGENLEGLRAEIRRITQAGGGRVFVNKRIANNWRIPTLVAAFPSARFVEIIRDGRAVAYSLSRVDWWDDSPLTWLEGGTPRQWSGAGLDPWELCAYNWVAELDATAGGLMEVDPQRHLRLRYEEFVAAPVETLERVSAFAGLASSAAWTSRLGGLRFPDRNESWGSKLDPAVIGRIEAIQAEKLRDYGYPIG
jgi:hypothetical protein